MLTDSYCFFTRRSSNSSDIPLLAGGTGLYRRTGSSLIETVARFGPAAVGGCGWKRSVGHGERRIGNCEELLRLAQFFVRV